ncbi:MAG: hypothetical protein GKR96_07615 [Gammaproteobacteria bacterium]|nr:hypothetical protein [Gammaproteobacteria bacterium]
MSKRLIPALLVISLLSACGFHLRGNFSLPESLSSVSLSGGDRDFIESLTNELERNGTAVVISQPNTAQLNIANLEYLSSVSKTDALGRATSYTYYYNLDYSVVNGNGETLQPLKAISQQRTQEYDPNQELLAEQEKEFLKKEMEKGLILQLLRRLSRL